MARKMCRAWEVRCRFNTTGRAFDSKPNKPRSLSAFQRTISSILSHSRTLNYPLPVFSCMVMNRLDKTPPTMAVSKRIAAFVVIFRNVVMCYQSMLWGRRAPLLSRPSLRSLVQNFDMLEHSNSMVPLVYYRSRKARHLELTVRNWNRFVRLLEDGSAIKYSVSCNAGRSDYHQDR